MSETMGMDPHEHDFKDSPCSCGDSVKALIQRLRETITEQVEYTRELQAQLDARGIDDGKVR